MGEEFLAIVKPFYDSFQFPEDPKHFSGGGGGGCKEVFSDKEPEGG